MTSHQSPAFSGRFTRPLVTSMQLGFQCQLLPLGQGEASTAAEGTIRGTAQVNVNLISTTANCDTTVCSEIGDAEKTQISAIRSEIAIFNNIMMRWCRILG